MEDATTELPQVAERVEDENGELFTVEEAGTAIDAGEEPTSTITAIDEPADHEMEGIVATTAEEVELPPPRLMITKMVSYHFSPPAAFASVSSRQLSPTIIYLHVSRHRYSKTSNLTQVKRP